MMCHWQRKFPRNLSSGKSAVVLFLFICGACCRSKPSPLQSPVSRACLCWPAAPVPDIFLTARFCLLKLERHLGLCLLLALLAILLSDFCQTVVLPHASNSERTLVSEGVWGRGVRMSEGLESALAGKEYPELVQTSLCRKESVTLSEGDLGNYVGVYITFCIGF